MHPDDEKTEYRSPEDALLLDDMHTLSFEERAEHAEQDAFDEAASQERIENSFAALEQALIFLHPHDPVEPLMREIRRRFVCPAAFFEAPKHVLESIGIPPREALLFSQVPAITRYVARNRLGRRPRLKNVAAAGEFLKTRYTGLAIEHFYLLCLDASGKLIECTLLQQGTTDSAPFYLRHVLMEVVRTRAHAIVISHNHPNFSARPSQADIKCTLELLRALHPIGSLLLDHIIVSGKEYASLREYGFLRANLWLQQAPNDPLLRRWLERP